MIYKLPALILLTITFSFAIGDEHIDKYNMNSNITTENITKSVRASANKFYLALNIMFTGELGPMEKIWSHRDDVSYMGPEGGFSLGWQQVLTQWEKQAAMKLGGKVQAKDMYIVAGRDLAIVSNYEIGKNAPEKGNSREVKIRATSVFRNENGTWKMIGHHSDKLPFLEK
jgi:ketosteroid isomerase-like protein